jgi:hypothetical protein
MTALTPLSYSRITKQKKQSLLQSGDCKRHERAGVSCICPRSLHVVDAYARRRVRLSVGMFNFRIYSSESDIARLQAKLPGKFIFDSYQSDILCHLQKFNACFFKMFSY